MKRRDDNEPGDDLGKGLAPGAGHYRAYVGPPEDYDLVAAMTFGLLAALGLRQHHALLDVGCGSLRVGRLLIPYLNEGMYTGFEPNRWLVEEGVRKECGADQIDRKRPAFIYESDPSRIPAEARFDFALAQSIFSHAGPKRVEAWFSALATRLGPRGALVATYLPGEQDPSTTDWAYPDCIEYRPETLGRLAAANGFEMHSLDWQHPRQRWCLFARPDFSLAGLDASPLSWNASLSAGRWADHA